MQTTAWIALLSKTYHDRSRVFAIQYSTNLRGGQTAILTLPLLTHGRIATAGVKESMPTLGLILAVVFPIALIVTLRPRRRRRGRRSRGRPIGSATT